MLRIWWKKVGSQRQGFPLPVMDGEWLGRALAPAHGRSDMSLPRLRVIHHSDW